MASVDELKDLGNKAFAAGKFAEAVEHFTEAIALDSSLHVLFSNRSACFTSLKKYDAALRDAEKTVSLKPDWSKGYSRLGAALHGLRRYQEAAEAYEKGLKIEPDNKALKDGLEQVNKQLKEREEESEEGANALANAFKAPDAMDKLRANPTTAAFMKDPEFVKRVEAIRANPQLFQLYAQDQRLLQAVLTLMGLGDKISMADPSKGGAASGKKAADLVVEDDEDDDVEDLTAKPAAAAAPAPAAAPKEQPKAAAPPAEPENRTKAKAEKELGTAAYKNKQFEEALKHYTAAAELDPTDMVYQLNISAVYFETKEFDKCIEAATKAIEIGESNQASFETIGKAYARASKAAVAKDDLETGLKLIGKALTNQRNPEYVASQKYLEKEIAERKRKAYLDPVKATEHKNKGNELFKAGNFPEAVQEYTESLKRNPEDSKVYGNRAACYIKLAAFPLAIQDCDEAIKREPTFIKAFIRKGNAFHAMKKYSEAISAYHKAADIDPNNSEVIDGLQKSRQAMMSNMSQKERQEAAMQNPEVQAIMADPVMQTILQSMTQDPKAAREHLRNPAIAAKLQVLIDAGIVSYGSA
eukprot:m.18097 g.18097  ORF g.18097 m.18097 type:complete len:585 (-) comp7293_c0_seq1:25-1779(-)